jgi:cell wall-associated NlpC family hydrolase
VVVVGGWTYRRVVTGDSVGAYVAQVDRVLGSGQAVYAAPAGPAGVAGDEPTVPPAPVKSGLNLAVTGAADRYGELWRGITALDAENNGTAGAGSAERRRGSATTTGVRDSARSQAAAIAPAAGSPAGVRLLVSSMDERLAAVQRQLDTTKAQNHLLATRLRQLATAYRMTAATSPWSRGMPMRGGAGSSMPNLGAFTAGPMSALSGLGHGGTHPQQPIDAEMTGLFGGDQRTTETAARAVQYAKTKLGLPYVWGAQGPRAYDCSGLVQNAYRHAGISLPRTTYDLIGVGTPVPRSEVREGDLVLSNFSAPGRPEHVQLAVSPTMVIEAPTPGGHVQYSSIPSGRIVVKRVT